MQWHCITIFSGRFYFHTSGSFAWDSVSQLPSDGCCENGVSSSSIVLNLMHRIFILKQLLLNKIHYNDHFLLFGIPILHCIIS